MPEKRAHPYVWVTWLPKLLAGDSHCEWGAWFRAHHELYVKVPDTFDSIAYTLAHTRRIKEVRARFEAEGKTVRTEHQNKFKIVGHSGAVLSGKPDLIALSANSATICDIKTGKQRTSDAVQVMVYMWAVPKAFPEFKGLTLDGLVVYNDTELPIPASAIDKPFAESIVATLRRIIGPNALRKVPSTWECHYCDIAKIECPERVEEVSEEREGEFGEF